VRGAAVRLVANKLFTEDYLIAPIERFARDALFSFVDAQSGSGGSEEKKETPDEAEEKKETGDAKEQDREIALYFALCMKKARTLLSPCVPQPLSGEC
jgi:hypothetical protein